MGRLWTIILCDFRHVHELQVQDVFYDPCWECDRWVERSWIGWHCDGGGLKGCVGQEGEASMLRCGDKGETPGGICIMGGGGGGGGVF